MTAAPSVAVEHRTVTPWWVGSLVVFGALVVWEVAVRIASTPVYLLPAPSDVAAVLGSSGTGLVPAALTTLLRAVAGLAVGAAFGIGLAVLITFRGHLEQGVMSLALLIKSTPVIAVAPILTIWMGFGHGPKVIVTALLTFFPVLINALEGFRSVDPAIAEWLRSIDASPREVFVRARWPSSWPFLFAALKVAAPLALIGAVVAEWMGASSGLGRQMWLAYTNLRMPSLFAAVAVLTVLSLLLYRAVVGVERKVLDWR
jgi:ABC-type nitrate/sulfonate/bicarbonate transport system permease component